MFPTFRLPREVKKLFHFCFSERSYESHNSVIVSDVEMKSLKLILIATTIAILTVATIGVALAYNYGGSSYYGGMMGYSTPYEDEDWWIEMREHMDDHWNEIQDEEWYNDMRAYMNEHIEDVENQDWFDEMTQFMEDQRYESRYRFDSGYGYGYHGCH